jgi:hypothetical protein
VEHRRTPFKGPRATPHVVRLNEQGWKELPQNVSCAEKRFDLTAFDVHLDEIQSFDPRPPTPRVQRRHRHDLGISNMIGKSTRQLKSANRAVGPEGKMTVVIPEPDGVHRDTSRHTIAADVSMQKYSLTRGGLEGVDLCIRKAYTRRHREQTGGCSRINDDVRRLRRLHSPKIRNDLALKDTLESIVPKEGSRESQLPAGMEDATCSRSDPGLRQTHNGLQPFRHHMNSGSVGA